MGMYRNGTWPTQEEAWQGLTKVLLLLPCSLIVVPYTILLYFSLSLSLLRKKRRNRSNRDKVPAYGGVFASSPWSDLGGVMGEEREEQREEREVHRPARVNSDIRKGGIAPIYSR